MCEKNVTVFVMKGLRNWSVKACIEPSTTVFELLEKLGLHGFVMLTADERLLKNDDLVFGRVTVGGKLVALEP